MTAPSDGGPPPRKVIGEAVLERALWSSRLLMIVGVAGAVLLTLIVLWMTAIDLVVLTGNAIDYGSAADRSELRADLIGGIVKTIDSFLLAAILILISFGLYELFISRLDPARDGNSRPRILLAISIDDLKDRISKLVVLILVIEFFQKSLESDLSQAGDLLRLAGAISLVAVALTLPSLVGKPSAGDQLESNKEQTHD